MVRLRVRTWIHDIDRDFRSSDVTKLFWTVVGTVLGGAALIFLHVIIMGYLLDITGYAAYITYGAIDTVAIVAFSSLAFETRLKYTIRRLPAKKFVDKWPALLAVYIAIGFGLAFAEWALIRYFVIDQAYGDYLYLYEGLWMLFYALLGLNTGYAGRRLGVYYLRMVRNGASKGKVVGVRR